MPLPSIRHAPFIAVLVLASCRPAAGPPAAPAPRGGLATGPAITAADLRTRLYILADDSMRGREAGTPGNVMATDYIAREVQRMGLQPAGEDGSYFQTVPLVTRQVDPATTLAVGGAALTLWQDFAPLPPLGSLVMASAGSVDDRPVVYAGRLGQDSLLDPDQAAGKVLLFDAQRDSDGRRRFGIAGGVIRRYTDAAALVFANLDATPPQVIGFLRSGGATLPQPDSHQGPVVLLVTDTVARQVFGQALEGLSPGSAAVARLSGHLGFVQVPVPAPARNVIAVLPGRDPALRGEFMALSAHSDHEGVAETPVDHDSLRAYNTVMRPWGASTRGVGRPSPAQWQAIAALRDSLRTVHPPRLDSVMNGADDDGSGSVALLEIAQALAAQRQHPRRSLLFIWHTAEEKGLLGSQWFTDHPTVPRDSLVGLLNMDMVGRGQPEIPGDHPVLQIIGSRRLSTELGDLIETVNRRPGHGFRFDYSFDANGHEQNRYCRSDHYMYARYGIPISYFSAGYHQDYHQLTDEPQYIHYDHLARVARLLADVAFAAADLDHRLVVDHPTPDPKAPCRQ